MTVYIIEFHMVDFEDDKNTSKIPIFIEMYG